MKPMDNLFSMMYCQLCRLEERLDLLGTLYEEHQDTEKFEGALRVAMGTAKELDWIYDQMRAEYKEDN